MKDVSDPSNSRLFETGQLQVARFNSDGSATWLAVNPETPVDPFLPTRFSDADLGCPLELPHSDSQRTGGDEEFQVHDLVDRDGGIFKQLRKVPLGSNWPVQAPGRPPPGPVGLDSPTEWSSLIGGLIQAWDQGHGSD